MCEVIHFGSKSVGLTKHSVATGSPLGPTLANIQMGYIKLNVIKKFMTKYPNTKCMRHVDDCFVTTSSEFLFQKLNEFSILLQQTQKK